MKALASSVVIFSSTPTFYVANIAYRTALSYDELKAIVDSAAKK